MNENPQTLFDDTEESSIFKKNVGEFGEWAAAEFLEKNGYQLVLSNFKTPVGRNRRGVQVTGEIDLIAFDGNTLCFIEVKTRSSDRFASPLSAVDVRKQRQITRTARAYRKIFRVQKNKYRFDVVAVLLNGRKAPKINLYKGFWTEEKFKKKSWTIEF